MRRVRPPAAARALVPAFTLALVVLGTARAADPARWLHVRVLESKDGETVRVNLPLKMIEAALPTLRNVVVDHCELGSGHLDEVDLHALLTAVRDGEEIWRARLPFTGNATPMSYRLRPDGRQFVVLAAGGHGWSEPGDALVAFALER